MMSNFKTFALQMKQQTEWRNNLHDEENILLAILLTVLIRICKELKNVRFPQIKTKLKNEPLK